MTLSKIKKPLKLLLKLAGTSAAIYWLASNTDFHELQRHISLNHWPLYLLAFLLYNISQFISSERLMIIIRDKGFSIERSENLKLYYIGMFYNFFLPSGIGGDLYKAYYYNKQRFIPIKKSVLSLFQERIFGLAAMAILFTLFFSWSFWSYYSAESFPWLITCNMIAALLGFFLFVKIVAVSRSLLFRALTYSLLLQAIQSLMMYVLLTSVLNVSFSQELAILGLIQIAIICSVLPISIGGIGVKELVLFWGASLIQTSSEALVAVGILSLVISLFSSLLGLPFLLRGHPTLKRTKP